LEKLTLEEVRIIGYSFMRVFVYAENVLEQLAPNTKLTDLQGEPF
jgi:hypothetical protein